MASRHATHLSRSPDETAALARRIGSALGPGDTLLLSGEIGAGKSHFSRHLILSRLPEPEDVPSPTFTLVQTYEAAGTEIWHADLYRLTDPDQVVELGLLEAFAGAICLVEWPDRLQDLAPDTALHMRFATGPDEESRAIDMRWTHPRWDWITDCVEIG